MKTSLIIILIMSALMSTNTIADEKSAKNKTDYVKNAGAPAGDMATGYAVGYSTAVGCSVISVMAGVALATMNSGGSNTSTTTTTTTIPGK